MRIVLAGAVGSTLSTLNSLIKHKMHVVGVLGYEPESIKNVSGYQLLKPTAESNDLSYKSFVQINDPSIVEQIEEWNPDLLFVVGLSQIVGEKIINSSKKGVVGFHPTALPRGRGRAPLAWSILEEQVAGANFFLIDKGVDSGSILEQELFEISDDDYAEDVELKIIKAIEIALDRLLPKLKEGRIEATEQDHSKATYYGKRTPRDGWIDWNESASNIHKLIRASSRPHPGARSFKGNFSMIIWKAKLEKGTKIKGVVGRILDVNDQSHLLIQTGEGSIWIQEYELFDFDNNKIQDQLIIGQKLGYYSDIEIFSLKKEINNIKKQLK